MKQSIFILSALCLLGTASLVAQTPQESVETLTNRAQTLRRGGWRTDEFSRAIRDRAAAFQALIRTNPRKAVELALTQDDAARLSDWSEDVESTGTWTGPLETRVEDDPTNGSRRRYYLTTANEELEVFPADAL